MKPDKAERPPPEKAFYTIPELEARWGVSRWTIGRLANEGSLKRSRVRGLVRFSSATVKDYESRM
jgi:excisionase family DNA binding protein